MANFEPVLTKGLGEYDLCDIDVYESRGGFGASNSATRCMVLAAADCGAATPSVARRSRVCDSQLERVVSGV